MRLKILIKICIFTILVSQTNKSFAQTRDSSYWSSWASLYKIIDSSFTHRTDTSIKQQSALIQFDLTAGIIDTFYIWSVYDKDVTSWLKPFFKEAIGRYFKGYKQFKHVIVPITVTDYRVQPKESDMQSFIFISRFIGAFKHAYNGEVTIAQGLYLEPPWPALR